MKRALIVGLILCCAAALPANATVLTLKVHWFDGVKASGSVTITGNGLLCNGATCKVADNNDGTYTLTVPLTASGAYSVTWTSNYVKDANGNFVTFFFPFSICIDSTSLCLDPSTIADAEIDLIFARPTDAGGFRLRDAKPSVHFVFP